MVKGVTNHWCREYEDWNIPQCISVLLRNSSWVRLKRHSYRTTFRQQRHRAPDTQSALCAVQRGHYALMLSHLTHGHHPHVYWSVTGAVTESSAGTKPTPLWFCQGPQWEDIQRDLFSKLLKGRRTAAPKGSSLQSFGVALLTWAVSLISCLYAKLPACWLQLEGNRS